MKGKEKTLKTEADDKVCICLYVCVCIKQHDPISL